MEIQKMFLTPNRMSRPQIQLKKVTKIAVHYVGNPNSTAIANRNYFENLKNQSITYASSHYIIGLQDEIIQCIPESEIAYCTNAANEYSISIECCHPDTTGKFNDLTYASLIDLCADICKRYNLAPITDMIRHYDVTGKSCPLYYVKNPSEWAVLKARIQDRLSAQKTVNLAEQAIDTICQKCGFNSPEYWKCQLKNVKYFNDFVLGVVKNLK